MRGQLTPDKPSNTSLSRGLQPADVVCSQPYLEMCLGKVLQGELPQRNIQGNLKTWAVV